VDSGELIGELPGHSDFVADAAFSQDGLMLASYHLNGDILVWDVASRREIKRIVTYIIGGGEIDWMPDGKTIVITIGGMHRVFWLIDTATGYVTRILGQPIPSRESFAEQASDVMTQFSFVYTRFDISADGERLLTANASDAVILWDIASNGQQILREESERKGRLSVINLIFVGDQIYFSDTQQGMIYRYEAGQETAALPIRAAAFAVSPDGERIVWVPQNEQIVRGNLIEPIVYIAQVDAPEAAEVLFELPEGLRVIPRIEMLAFTSDGKKVLIGGFLSLSHPEENGFYVVDVE
jgi:hypothetical protein